MSSNLQNFIENLSLSAKQEQKLIDYAKLLLAQEQAVANNTFYAYPKKAHYTFDDLQEIATQYSVDKKWTYNQLLDAFPETAQKIEIIDSQLRIMPSPSEYHQNILLELAVEFRLHAKRMNSGKVYVAPLDVVLSQKDVLQPDIIFILENSRNEIVQPNGVIQGSPELVVEILSPANHKAERERKKTVYEKFGVKEYWEINPQTQTVTVELLKQERYALFSQATAKGNVKSSVLEGFEIEINVILSKD